MPLKDVEMKYIKIKLNWRLYAVAVTAKPSKSITKTKTERDTHLMIAFLYKPGVILVARP